MPSRTTWKASLTIVLLSRPTPTSSSWSTNRVTSFASARPSRTRLRAGSRSTGDTADWSSGVASDIRGCVESTRSTAPRSLNTEAPRPGGLACPGSSLRNWP